MSKPAENSKSNLSKTTGPMGKVVGGNAKAVPPRKSAPKTTPKTQPTSETGATSASAPPRAQKASAQVDAQSVLETARSAVQNLAQHNATQAQRLGVELARAEQAFPLVMMDAYAKEKQALQEAGLDAQTFLHELGEQVAGIAAFDATVTLSAAAERPVLTGGDAQT